MDLNYCKVYIYNKITQNINKSLSNLKLNKFDKISIDICKPFNILELKKTYV